MKELTTLVDYTIAPPGPTIDQTGFPNAFAAVYWTSSSVVSDPSFIWVIYFNFGQTSSNTSPSAYIARCVR
jgi:hypothetical protein